MVAFLAGAGLSRQKIPEQLEIVAEVPRNVAGKIQKQLLRERFG
jgi:acyl-CoA synthetase (AMP-forming)/AMP-acid ligase II